MLSKTVEDYLKEIFMQQQTDPESWVHINSLAEALEITAGSVTVMVQGLAKAGLVDYRRRIGSRLTPSGEHEALQVLRRHRLIEAFLVKIMGFDWSEVHVEAHQLEHVISDRVLERMDAMLDHPAVDPHGDPIPDAAGKIDQTVYASLIQTTIKAKVQVVRILDQSPEFLCYLESKGIIPGSQVTLETASQIAGAYTIGVAGLPSVVVGEKAAKSILVTPSQTSQ